MKFKSYKSKLIYLFSLNPLTHKIFEAYESRKAGTLVSSTVNFGPKFSSCINLDSSFFENTENESKKFQIWKDDFKLSFEKGISRTILKFGDGDYFFLNQIEKGSAKPGKRALSKAYSQIDMKTFYEGIDLADQVSCETILDNLDKYSRTIKKAKPDFPAEFIYAAVSSKWLTSEFDGNLGIIGASEKIDLIEKLLDNNLYREFLGITRDIEFIRIKQKFACDDIEKTKNTIEAQFKTNEKRLYLFGVGHAKFGLVDLFKRQKNSTFLDIGSGIDALAGVIDIRRPYFGNWTNFQFVENAYYKEIDYLQAFNFGKRIIIS